MQARSLFTSTPSRPCFFIKTCESQSCQPYCREKGSPLAAPQTRVLQQHVPCAGIATTPGWESPSLCSSLGVPPKGLSLGQDTGALLC